MTKQEYETELKALKERIAELEKTEIEEGNGVWKPKNNEYYYYIDDEGNVLEDYCIDDFEDSKRLTIGNVFRTQKEAEDEVERLRVLAELKPFTCKFRPGKDNWYLIYNNDNKEIELYFAEVNQAMELHFPSEEIAKKALEVVKEDRIKKYVLGVE